MKIHIILLFIVVAMMRVIQQVCEKLVSNEVSGAEKFFAYGAFYQYMAALFALVTVLFTGFYGFNFGLIVCSFLCAILFGVDLFACMEAVKGCSLAVLSMFSLGGLVLSIIVSYFWFNEPVSVFQIIGLIVFFVAAYLLLSYDKKSNIKISFKTFTSLLVSFFANGLIMIAQKYFALKVNEANTPLFSLLTFFLCGTMMIISFAFTRLKAKRKTKEDENGILKTKERVLNKKLIICGSLLAVAVFLINIIITEMGKTVPSIIVFPVSTAISVLIATLVGCLIFKDKLTTKKIAGIILGVISIVIISVFTPENISTLF